MEKIRVYITTVSGSLEIKKKQQKIESILGSNYKDCEVEYIDIATKTNEKDKMREIVGDPKAIPPQITKGNQYLGDYNAFEDAVETGELQSFLRI